MNKGFTLVELLGVIVIISVISFLLLPKVINTVKSAKSSSDDLTDKIIINSAKLYVSDNDSMYEKTDGVKYCITLSSLVNNGYLSKPITYDNSSVDITSLKSVQITYTDKFNYKIVNNEDCVNTYRKYNNGEAVYFNVTTGEKCSAIDAVSNRDTKSGCMKFYAFNDEGNSSTTVNLILDHNTTALVAWNSSSGNSSGPSEVLTQLASDTENWTGVEVPDAYTNTSKNYTVDYTNYGGKARLISANEIAKITGNISWNESDVSANWYYLDSKTQIQTATTQGSSAYAWLFDYTNGCTSSGCNIADSCTYGYWTVSSDSSSANSAWLVDNGGYVGSRNVGTSDHSGIRPVITVKKSKLS